jgi:hypothetical protein
MDLKDPLLNNEEGAKEVISKGQKGRYQLHT